MSQSSSSLRRQVLHNFSKKLHDSYILNDEELRCYNNTVACDIKEKAPFFGAVLSFDFCLFCWLLKHTYIFLGLA